MHGVKELLVVTLEVQMLLDGLLFDNNFELLPDNGGISEASDVSSDGSIVVGALLGFWSIRWRYLLG